MRVPLMNLKAQYQGIKHDVDEAIRNSIDNCQFIGGPQVKSFNEAYAAWLGVKRCVGVGNGTDALVIALKALGIGPGDEVIVPANSFIATSEACSMVGAKPVFADCLPHYYTLDPVDAAAKVTPATKAIIPVHLYGYCAEMDEIMDLATRHNLFVIEDTAQGHGALYKGKKAGSIGHLSTFSFYPGKNLGAYGDAGAVCGNDEALMERVYMFANHGRKDKYNHEFEGINSRLDGVQAAVLNVKLPRLDEWNRARNYLAGKYSELLRDIPQLELPQVAPEREHVYYVYTVLAQNRDALQAHLKLHGIDTGIYYPVALPYLPAYNTYGHVPADFPVTYDLQSRILSLPMFPEMTREEQIYVAEVISSFYQN